MPQLPNSSTEDLGADDEVKEYKQEDGEDTENGAHLDLVNDIKSDLIKKETENSEVSGFFQFLLSCQAAFCQQQLFLQTWFDFYCAERYGLVQATRSVEAASFKVLAPQNHIVWENSK